MSRPLMGLLATICLSLVSHIGWAEEPVLAGAADGGFVLRSADGHYVLKPSVVMQLQHRFQDIESAPDTNDFFLRRGRVKLAGNVITQRLEYEVEFDVGTPDPGAPQFDLKDLFFDYHVAKFLRVRGGQFKVPFGFQELTSSKRQQFVDRSLASEEFVPGRDIGVQLWGPAEGALLEYYVGLFNGDGDNAYNANTDFLYAARVAVNPLGAYDEHESDLAGTKALRLSLGGSAVYNKDSTASDQQILLAAFVGFKFAGLSFRSEYFKRINRSDVSTDADDQDAQGVYGQLGYFLIPQRLELAARSSQVIRQGSDNNERTYAGAVNYFFKGQNAKIQVDYTLQHDEDAIAGPNTETRHIVRTQFQLFF